MNGSLTRSVTQAATWIGIAEVIGQALLFISTVVLARLLSPDDFGVIAMAAIITSATSEIIDLGFNRALIQRKDIKPSHLSTTFWISLAFGIFLCIVVVICSPFVAGFFGDELVGPVLAISSISFVITPLGSVHGALLRKGMDFFKFAISDVGEAVVYIIAAISLAFAGFGVWSVIVARLLGRFTSVCLRWILARWRPSLLFSFNSLKELWSFGFNVTGIRIVDFLNKRSDYIIIGRFLSTADLGFYNLALRVVNLPVDRMIAIVSRVVFPAFSLIQDENERLSRGLIKGARYLSIIGLPLFTGAAIVAPELVSLVFSSKWLPAVIPMQILCIWATANLLSIAIPSLIMAKGRPNIYLRLTIAKAIIYIPCLLFIGVKFGTTGVAICLAAVSVVFSFVQQIIAIRMIGLRIWDYLSAFGPAVLATVIMALGLIGFRTALINFLDVPDILILISSIILGIVIYIMTLKITRNKTLNEIIQLSLDTIRPFRRPISMIRALLRPETTPPSKEDGEQQ